MDEESQRLTCFITPFGRYICKCLPFGINCASDYFTKMFSELLSDIPNVSVHVDDILIYANSQKEHDEALNLVLERLQKEGVTLNKDKCIISVKELDFLRHHISENGISVLPERVSAITNFPTPKNKEAVQQFLGIVNYVGMFLPDKSTILDQLLSLLKKNSHFVWLEPQQSAFLKIKNLIKASPILAHFDFYKKIVVQADASGYALGAAL